MTALAQRLERAGYVRREPHPRDKRSTVLSADPRILEEAGDLYEPLVSALDWATSELGTDERAAIGRYLERIVAISEEKADDVARATDDEAALAGAPVPALWT